MCFGKKGGGGDGGAEELRRQEAERQARVASARGAVQSQFAGFGDDFYGGLEKSYVDYYMPEFTRQRDRARERLTLQAPSTNSSAYRRSLEDFERDALTEESNIRSSGRQAALDARGRVEQSRGSLLAQAETGAGAEGLASLASEQARINSAPPVYSPLADLFARYTAIGANNAIGQAATGGGGGTQLRPLLYNAGGSSSAVRTVR